MNFKSWLMSHVCLESFYIYVLYSWSYSYVSFSMNDGSWGRSAVAYAFLTSSLFTGRIFGRVIYKSRSSFRLGVSKNNLNVAFLILSSLFLGIAITTRYSLLIGIYFAIGFTASRVGASQDDRHDKESGQHQTHHITGSASDAEAGLSAKRQIATFMFLTLLSSLMFSDTSDASVAFPAFHVCSTYSAILVAIFLLNVLSERLTVQQLSGYLSCKKNSQRSRQAGISGQKTPKKPHRKYSEDVQEASPSEFIIADSQIPQNFLTLHNNNMVKARKSYIKSLVWRKENKIDHILTTHQDNFNEILRLYPHALHRYSIDGCAVAYEILGKSKPKEMKSLGIFSEHLTWHFLMRNELLFQKFLPDGLDCMHPSSFLESNQNDRNAENKIESGCNKMSGSVYNDNIPNVPMGRMMTVIDVKGVSVSDISADVISFIKQSSEIMDNYYPGRVARLVICNAPSWFYSVWSMVARVLPESVRKKITIMSGTARLDEFIHPSQRPVEYGGTDVPLGQAPQHLAFLQLPQSWNKERDREREKERERDERNGDNDSQSSSYYSSSRSSMSGSVHERSEASDSGKDRERDRDRDRSSSSSQRKKSSKKKKSGSSSNGQKHAKSSGMPGSPVDISRHSSRDTSGGFKIFKNKAEKNVTSKEKTSSGGLFGWMGITDSRPKPSEAFLGEKNSYRYDSTTSSWTIDPIEEEEPLMGHNSLAGTGSGPHSGGMTSHSTDSVEGNRNRMSQDQLEEHGLVLAIQAAHLHSLNCKESAISFPVHPLQNHHSHQDSLNPSRRGSAEEFIPRGANNKQAYSDFSRIPLGEGREHEMDLGPSGRISNGDHTADRGAQMGSSKMSPHVFLLVINMYFLVCLMDSGLFALLPIWLISPKHKGGLGYSVVDVGLSVSSAGLLLYFLVDIFRVKIVHVLKNSPIRGMRIGCGMMVLFCFLLPNLQSGEHEVENVIISTANTVRSIGTFSLRGSALKSHTYAPETVHNGVRAAIFGLPHDSPMALLLPSVYLAGAVCAGQVSRKASAVLLHVALSPSFSSPATVMTAVRNLAEILGPIVYSLILAAVGHLNLRYPMDVSFLFSLTSCLSFLLYTCTLFLSIQYRGDFGLIADADADETTADSTANSNPPLREKNRNYFYEQNSGTSNAYAAGREAKGRGAFDIPISDWKVLFSSISSSKSLYSYGNKSHNFKMNLKDM